MNPFQDVFISYGRADSLEFATYLNQRLLERGYSVWFDFEDIPQGVDYQKQIDAGIEKADNFVFIISPHATNSPYCRKEIELAIALNKRLVPIMHVEQIGRDTWQSRNPKSGDADWDAYQTQGLHSCFTHLHPELAKINWNQVSFKEGINDFEQSFQALIDIFQRHNRYVHQHTVLLDAALTWQRNQRQTRFLLTGAERQNAETWLAERFHQPEQPPCLPADLHCEFITTSIKNAHNLMTQVLLCYAEPDREMAVQVRRSLTRAGITTWTPDTDIESGEDIPTALEKGLEAADNVVFLLSTHSLASEDCHNRLHQALALNKRIIPLRAGAIDGVKLPDSLQTLQAIDLLDNPSTADYQPDESDLLRILKRDAAYVHGHKVLLTKARKWERQQQHPCLLLRGYELQSAGAWLKLARQHQYGPLPLQIEFITESQRQPSGTELDVFVSYSQADSDFARQLNDGLQRQGKRTWFDQESIALGAADFQQEIYRGIEASNHFLFILSPKSVNSPYCADEVGYATQLNKRIVTVRHQAVAVERLHPALQKVQWIDFLGNNQDFAANFQALLRTLDADPEHLRFHTRLLMQAIAWDETAQRQERLLRGADLLEAEQWLLKATGKAPQPTTLQGNYVATSRALLEANRRTADQRQNLVIAGLTAGLLLMTTLAGFAGYKVHQAERRRMRLYEATARATETTDPLNSLVNGLAAIELGQSWFVRLPQLGQPPLVSTALLAGASQARRFDCVGSPGGDVYAVAVSPDGQTLISGHGDGTLQFWDMDCHPQGLPISGHTGPVESVAVSLDGQTWVSGGGDGTVRQWDRDGNPIGTPLQGHTDWVHVVAVSPDGQTIASNGSDNTVWLWDVAGNPIGTLQHSASISAIAFSPNGQTLVTGDHAGQLQLWDLTGTPLGEPLGEPFTATVTPESELLTNPVTSVAFSPDGQIIVSGGEDGQVRLWDGQGNAIAPPFKSDALAINPLGITSVAFSPDGQIIAGAGSDGAIRLWDVKGNLIGPPFVGGGAGARYPDRVTAVAFSPDGQTLVSSQGSNIWLWPLAKTTMHQLTGHASGVTRVDISPDGQQVVSGGFDGTVRLWDLENPPIVLRDHNGPVYAVAFSPDGQSVVSGGDDQLLRRWDLQGNGVGNPFAGHTSPVNVIAFSPDGQTLASGGSTLRLWDLDGNAISIPDQRQRGSITAIAFNPDGQTLVTGSGTATLGLWDLAGNPIGDLFESHIGGISGVAFSPDGQLLASSSLDGTLQLWDAVGNAIGGLRGGPANSLNAVAFSPDGQTLVIGNSLGQLQRWDLEGEVAIGHPLELHGDAVTTIALSADGETLVSGDEEGVIWVGPVDLLAGWVTYTCRDVQGYLAVRSETDEVAREALRTCERYGKG